MTVNGATEKCPAPLSFLPHDLDIIEPSGWNRPVTPLHAVGFLALCASLGFIVGLGLCALAALAGWHRFQRALGW